MYILFYNIFENKKNYIKKSVLTIGIKKALIKELFSLLVTFARLGL